MNEALFFLETNCLFVCYICWKPGAFHLEVLIKVKTKNDRYNADIIVTHRFRICSWDFPLWCKEEKYLVNFGDLPSDLSSIHGMILEFRCSEDKYGFFEVVADKFMSMEVMLFK